MTKKNRTVPPPLPKLTQEDTDRAKKVSQLPDDLITSIEKKTEEESKQVTKNEAALQKLKDAVSAVKTDREDLETNRQDVQDLNGSLGKDRKDREDSYKKFRDKKADLSKKLEDRKANRDKLNDQNKQFLDEVDLIVKEAEALAELAFEQVNLHQQNVVWLLNDRRELEEQVLVLMDWLKKYF